MFEAQGLPLVHSSMTNFKYEIKKYKQARYLRVSVKPGGRVVVTTPWRTPRYVAVQFVEKQQAWVEQARAKMLAQPTPANVGTAAEYKKYKLQAQRLIAARLVELNTQYAFPYKLVSIRNQKTRWGSCSKSGTLSFNYRLLFVDPAIRDYVLVHELCHTQHMNHSARFWALVARAVPNYKQLRAALHSLDRGVPATAY